MTFLGIWMMLAIVSINGRHRYLIREDMINVDFLKADNTPRLWPIYIDELVYRMADITNIEATLADLTRTRVSSEHWCKIPTAYMGLYNYSLENTITSLRNNITRWLPCGAFVKQDYISPSNPEDIITIHVNRHLHINVTIVEIHLDSLVAIDAGREYGQSQNFDDGNAIKGVLYPEMLEFYFL